MIKRFYHKIPIRFKNKYVVTLCLFAVWMIFFDQNDMISQIQLRYDLNELTTKKEYYNEQIEVSKNELEDLLTDNEKLERFAREKYLMKKDGEEIFVIVSESENNKSKQ